MVLRLTNQFDSLTPVALNNNQIAPLTKRMPQRSMSSPALPERPDSPSNLNGHQRRRERILGTVKPRLCRVMYPYNPRQTDELELVVGDVLTVTMKCDDGWFIGHSAMNGKFGTFPGNYVEEL